MTLFQFLRALVDLGFYYSFAGTVSAIAGGRVAPAALLLQSGCFALSFRFRRHRAARLAALVPAAAFVLLAGTPADMLAAVPPVIYLVCLVWKDNYQLSWVRQADIFRAFCWAFPIAALFFPPLGFGGALLAAGLPAALFTAAASLLLLRSLRHDPAMYLQPRFQAANCAGIALIAALALALGSKWAVRAALFLLGGLYNRVIAPFLLGLFMAVGFIILQFLPLLQWLVDHYTGWTMKDLAKQEAAFREQLEGFIQENAGGRVELFLQAAAALTILLVIVILVKGFRWLLRRREERQDAAPDSVRQDLPRPPDGRRSSPRASRYAQRIRRQYRAFLRLCQGRGIQIRTCDTSAEIGAKSLPEFPDEAALAALRDIYQEARYHGASSREDYLRFKRLLGTLKRRRG